MIITPIALAFSLALNAASIPNEISGAYGTETVGQGNPDLLHDEFETLSENERNHAQLTFCFGGYTFLYKVAIANENNKLAAKLYSVLKGLIDEMAALEYLMVENGELHDAWDELFESAIRVQIINGALYVSKVGPMEFLPDIRRCEDILKKG